MLINPSPTQASTIEGERCSIWWVDKSVDGWPFVTVTWVDSCPRSCPQDVAGDFHNQADTWCADLTPPPNIPGVYLGNACSASTSRTVTLLTDGTFGTNFEIEGNGHAVSGASYTFTNIPEGMFTARGQAHNRKGSSGWSSPVSAQHDYSAPITSANMVGLSQNGWYISPVSVSFNADDVGCLGVSQTVYAVNGVQNTYTGTPFTIATDGIHSLQYRSTDGYHLEAEKSGVIPIDSTAPTLQFVLDRPQDVAGWWTSPLSITIVADDATSGLASLEYDLNYAGWVSGDSLILTDGVHTLDAQATDNAGHIRYDGVVIPIDSTAPVLDVQITGEQGRNGWFIAPPTLTLSATDATSGVIAVLYQLENGSQTVYTAPLRFTREGLYTVQAFAVDYAQHITAQTVQIGYDITPPQTNAVLTETADGMTITLNRWDGVSGFAFTRVAINGVWGDYHAPVTVAETGEYWVQFYTIDVAGNIEAEKIVSFTIAEAGVVVTQVPPAVNIVPPVNPPNTPPFETSDDFPPDLHDENLYFVSPPPNKPPFETGDDFPPNLHNEGVYYIYPEDNRISRIPRPIVDESALPNVNAIPQPNVVYANAPNIIGTLQNLDVPESQTAPVTIQTTSTPITASNPLNGVLVTLATLGIITASAGVLTMTSTALARKKEQDEAKATQMATLQVQQSAQAQSAGANWNANQSQQAQAYQEVATQVTESQANIDFWVAYADWQERAIQAEFKRNIKSMIGNVLDDVQATAFYQNLLGITSFAKLAIALTILLFSINGIQVSQQYAENVVADIPTNSCNDLPEPTDVTNSVSCLGRGGGQEVGSRSGSPSGRNRANRGQPLDGSQTRVTSTNARILAKNMNDNGIIRSPDYVAHHIVPSTSSYNSAFQSRQILQRFGIDINSHYNGVFLSRPIHNPLHTAQYSQEIYRRLQQATNRQEAIQVLNSIANEIQTTGRLSFP